MTPLSIAVVLFLFAFASVALVMFVVAVLYFTRRKPDHTLVSPTVRKKLNADLDEAMARRALEQVKRDWLESDGWVLEQ